MPRSPVKLTDPEPWFRLGTGDAIAFLQALPNASIDLATTDPAYESLEKHRAKGTTTRLKISDASSNPWFEIFRNERFPHLFEELHRVLKRDAHLYVYCDLDTAKVIDPMGEAAGFKCWNWIVWDKRKMGMGYHYRRRKEFILFFEKGKRKLNDLGISDVLDGIDERTERGVDLISIDRVRGKDAYPTEKPVAVSEILIRQSTSPGEIVLDPFMGSGSVGEAAHRAGCRFMGVDLKQQAVDITRDRLAKLGPLTS